jgi:hypothetical protein
MMFSCLQKKIIVHADVALCGLLIATAALSMVALLGNPQLAQAQPNTAADVPALIKLIEQMPDGMDRSEWKDKRRDAARKLIAGKDKRAVATLAKLAEQETFDIIGEIAIEGLGQLADPSASTTLQRIAGDTGRDKRQRDLAGKALAKLGVKAAPSTDKVADMTAKPTDRPVDKLPVKEPLPVNISEPTLPEPSAAVETPSEPPRAAQSLGADPSAAMNASAGPIWSDDTLAATDSLTFAIGSASVGYDSVRKRTTFNADAAAQLMHRVEQQQRAFEYGVDARLVAGYVNPDGPGKSRGAELVVNAHGEYRIYGGPGLYGVGRSALQGQLTYLSVTRNDPNDAAFKDVRTSADLGLALGGGFGRVLNQGPRMRIARIEQVLRDNRALAKSIDDAVATQLQSIWWSQRGAASTYQSLVATVQGLRAAGVLLSEPDVTTTYQLLAVLRDSQLNVRWRGTDVDVTFGESYLLREDTPNNPPVDKGRVEQALLRARYGRALSPNVDIGGSAFARLRVLASANTPSPWAVGVMATAQRFTYDDIGDATGTIDTQLSASISSDDIEQEQRGVRLAAELGWTYRLRQASGLRIAANLAFDSGELFIGAKIDASYGLLTSAFSR